MTETLVQGSPEWIAARIGRVTASRMSDLQARTKSGWGAGRRNYMAELAAERLTGTAAVKFTNSAMQWGTDTQAQALATYEFVHDASVSPVGFVPHQTIPMSGASPDGLVGDAGLVEAKCPNTATHIATLLGGTIDIAYIKQMQWQMACTTRSWCDFVSFDPRLPPNLRLFVRRVARDDAAIKEAEADVRQFLSELDGIVAGLTGLDAADVARIAARPPLADPAKSSSIF